MGNQQAIVSDQVQHDKITPSKSLQVYPQIHPQEIKTDQKSQLPINTSQPKMKRPPLSVEPSFSFAPPASRMKVKRKNSSDNIQTIERFQEEDFLAMEQLDNIYSFSECNLESFLSNLEEPLSELYMALAKHALNLMSNKFSQNARQAKLFFCQKMLNTNLNILKTFGSKKNHQFDQNVFRKFNKLQKYIIGYLKTKYPKGQQNFVSGDLMNAFKSFDFIDNPENDIVLQSGLYFGKSNMRDLMKKIKGFLNRLIDEVDANFPRFQRVLQQKVFKTTKSSDKSLEYKINRRLPENISKFTSINSNSLDIISPELFRVILEWIEDMQKFILNPDEEVDSKQTLKVINEQDDTKYFADQINADDNYFVLKELKQKLHEQKENYQKELDQLIENMYKFQHNLIKIIEEAKLSERYVPRKDAEIIKFSAYNTKFMSWMLAEKLTIAMKILIKVGRHFKNTMLMMPLDLVKFNVPDMLRATLKGSKSEILQVYTNLKRLESEDQIKIIRLDNQLGTSLNGIVINFKMKNCFLICEVSLMLSESSQGSNEKLKNIEKLNNFFNDLEGSPYGVLSELAEYLGYKDSKVGYQGKINFVSKQFGIPICEIRHPSKIQSIKQQYEPFVCTSCSRFYGRLENTFIMKKCEQCNNFLCFKCIFSQNPSLETSCLKEQIIRYLNDQASYSSEITRGKSEGTVQGITGNLIYEKSFEKIIYMKEIQKEKKLKKMNRTQFEVYIDSLELHNFVYGAYEKGEIALTSLKYNETKKLVSFGLNENEDFYTSKKLGYKENDFLLIYDSNITFSQIQSGSLQKQPFINIFSKDRKLQKGKYESYKINEINLMISFIKQEKVIIDGMEVIDTNDLSTTVKKDFKFQSLKNYMEFKGIEQSGRTTLKLQDLGIEKRHFLELISMKWLDKVTEINISKNKITEINEVLTHLPNLKRLSAAQNYMQNITFPVKLSKLISLVLRRNLIKSISNVENIPNIEKINLQENKIEKFPVVFMKQLRHLNLAENYYLTSISFLEKPNMPQLNYVNLENSLENVQYSGHDQDRSINLSFPMLKCFIAVKLNASKIIFNSYFLQRLYLSFSPTVEIKTNLIDNLQYFVADSCKFTDMNFLFNQNNENHIIKEIDLSSNAITNLPPVFKSISLQKLILNNNLITDIKSLSQSSLPSLQSLKIENNQIKFLPSFQFWKLTELRLQGNPFDDIQEFAKSQLPLIETLQFSEALPIKSWPKFSLSGIKKLSLPSVQEPSTLTQFEASQLPNLQNLAIQSTKLNRFPLLNFPQLELLKVSSCTFEEMDTLVQSNLSNLKIINMIYINTENYNSSEEENKQRLKKYKIDLPNNLDKLEEINVLQCQFFNIQNILSKPFINVTKIQIQYSNLTTVPKMKLPNLKIIVLSNNKIENIANFCKSDLPQIQEVDLYCNFVTVFHQLRFKTLKNLNISRNKLEKLDTLDLPNLNRLDISYNNLKQFPVLWTQKLTQIIFEGNPLKNMKNLQKCQLPMLDGIAFSSIQLEEKSRVFPKFNFPSIESLYIYGMNFTQISNINCITKLQSLTISYCKEIKNFPYLNLQELKMLSIVSSQFQSWKGFQESKIANVTSLVISWTNIQTLKGTKLPNLIDLDVNQNQKLTSIEEFFVFNKFVQLESVILNGNNNLSITHQINLPSLKKIDITFGSLTSTKLIGISDRLTDIRIAESPIKEIDLKDFKKLQTLELMTNQIQRIDSFCLKEWRSLKILYLPQNKITKIPKMTKFPLLEFLNLSSNQIQNVNDLMQNSILHSLTSLTLSKNKIKRISAMKNFPKLVSLDLQNNEIESLTFLVKLQNINSVLHSICLNHNKIQKDIPPIKCCVEQLQLDNNLIQSMEWLKKSQLPRLAFLDLSNNNIKKLTSIENLSKLSSLVINLNPVEQYDELLFQNKLPASCGYISFSAKVDQNAIDADMEKFTAKYPNVSLSISEYEN